jgi:hypothetical protein
MGERSLYVIYIQLGVLSLYVSYIRHRCAQFICNLYKNIGVRAVNMYLYKQHMWA